MIMNERMKSSRHCPFMAKVPQTEYVFIDNGPFKAWTQVEPEVEPRLNMRQCADRMAYCVNCVLAISWPFANQVAVRVQSR
jgi:hypothetical protein